MNRAPVAAFAAFATRGLATRAVQHTYFVPRNTRGSVPVYTDIRNNGTRYLVEIRNVTGDTSALASDLKASLFADAEASKRLNVEVIRSRHLRLSGLPAHYKQDVINWLVERGF